MFERNQADIEASSHCNKKYNDLDVKPIWRAFLCAINLNPGNRLDAIRKATQRVGVSIQRAAYVIAQHSPVGCYR